MKERKDARNDGLGRRKRDRGKWDGKTRNMMEENTEQQLKEDERGGRKEGKE